MDSYTLHIHHHLFRAEAPCVMAVLNCWCHSFCTSTHLMSESDLLHQAEKALTEGAQILDLGACPTHPNQSPISEEEEWKHIQRAAQLIRQQWPDVWLSVDTFRAEVARRAVEEYGIDLVNDISGGQMDERMFDTVAALQVPYVLTHMRGTPENMQSLTNYTHLMSDLIDFFQQRINQLHQLGVRDVVVDPGFGFAKTLEQNYQLLAHLNELNILKCPVLVGLSRKSMLYRLLNISADEALNATTAAHMLALERGAAILRVHDVAEAQQAIRIYQQTKNNY